MSQTKAQLIDPTDGSIVNADINASAAIAGSKISPDFGSQNIVTTGGLTVDTTTLHVDTSNNRVGIGLTNPSCPLEISSASNPVIKATSSSSSVGAAFTAQGGSSNDSQLVLSSGTTAKYTFLRDGSQSDDLRIYDSANALDIIRYRHGSYLHFGVNGSERMRIDSSGRVGIGTTSPATLLNLNVDTEANLGSGSEGIRLTSGSSNAQFVRLGSSYSNNSVTGPGTLLFSSNKLSLRCDNGNPITFHTGSTVAERMRITSDAKFGFNLTPDASGGTVQMAPLHGYQSAATNLLTSASKAVLRVRTSSDSSMSLYVGAHNNTARPYLQVGNMSSADGGATAVYPLLLQPFGGDVGIGTSTPAVNLDVSAGSGTTQIYVRNTATSGEAALGVQGKNSSGTARTMLVKYDNNDSFRFATAQAVPITFSTSDAERMRINANGYVSIGTTGNSYQLHVKGGIVDQTVRVDNTKTGNGDINYIGIGLNTVTTGSALFGHTGHTTAGSQAAWMGLGGDDVAGGVGVRVFRTGKVNMGNTGTSNNATLSVRGAGVSPISCLCNQTSGHTQIFFVNPNGNVGQINTINSETRYFTTSDYRLKENVVNLTGAITRLKTLQPKRFNWISDETNTLQDGFLAHEVTAVPEAISGTKDAVAVEDDVNRGLAEAIGDPIYQNIDNSKLVPLLTAALQEAVAEIDTLKTKVAALEAA